MIEIGSEFEARVRDLAADGTGIVAHPNGQVFFVPGVWRDEQVRVRISEFRGRAGRARLRELLDPSPHRIKPPCPHHGQRESQCGGCPWQFVSYPAQLAEKQVRVSSALQRAGVDLSCLRPIWGSDQIFGYRNRAQFKTDGRRLGYVAASSNQLVDITECLILSETNQRQLRNLRSQLPENSWRPGRRERWNTLDIDEDTEDGTVSLNQRRPFRQANTAQNHRMREWLRTMLQDRPKEPDTLELFCGSGNFTEVLSDLGFRHIYAADGAGQAIAELQARQLPGVTAFSSDLFAANSHQKPPLRELQAEVLVLDPPRDGYPALPELLARQRKLQTICYVSCNLATFTRDLGALLTAGFLPHEIQPLDQFPHTPHIELLALFTRRGRV